MTKDCEGKPAKAIFFGKMCKKHMEKELKK